MITKYHIDGAFPTVPLGEVAEFLDHKRRPITAKDRVAGPIPYYGANGQQDSVADYIFDEPLILVAEDGGHFDDPDRGIAYRISGRSWVNNHAHVLRPRSNMDLAFLCRVLENYDVRPFISGSTRGKLTKGQASTIKVPVPPLPEQRRIAAILDQADALRRLNKSMLNNIEVYRRSTFAVIFAETFADESTYVPLRELCDVRDGTHESPKFVEEGYPLLTSKNFSTGYLDASGAKKISRADYDKINLRSKVNRGDIVMPMIGTIGSPVVVEDEPYFAIKNVALIKMAGSTLTPRYVKEVLDSDIFRRHVYNCGRGGTQKFLSLGDIRDFLVPVPSALLLEQHMHLIERSTKARSHLRAQTIKLAGLFTSLQHRAFRGKL